MAEIGKGPISRQLHIFNLIENYIYFYHTNTFLILPAYPDTITDSSSASFTPTHPLLRSAPIWSYTGSGPRTVSAAFSFHRDVMEEINQNVSNAKLAFNDDYTDKLVKEIQACVMPSYTNSTKEVTPPMVAMRIGSDVFIKGIVNGPFSIAYDLPIMVDKHNPDGFGKYAKISFSVTITEVEPYDAEAVMKMGSFRGNLSTNMYRSSLETLGGVQGNDTDLTAIEKQSQNIDGNATPKERQADPEVNNNVNANTKAGGTNTGSGGNKNIGLVYSYTLIYNANGGVNAPEPQEYDTTYTSWTFKCSSTKPTRSGYTFLGWSFSSTATKASYFAGDSVKLSSKELHKTLHAVWSKNSTYAYTLSYNANGGVGTPKAQEKDTTSTSWKFTCTSEKPSRSGYIFLGWSFSSTATKASYVAGNSVTLNCEDPYRVLYAIWAKAEYKYTLKYSANGGSGAPSTVTATSKYASYTFVCTKDKPIRANYEFVGWSDSATSSHVIYQGGSNVLVTIPDGSTSATKTIYAVWNRDR